MKLVGAALTGMFPDFRTTGLIVGGFDGTSSDFRDHFLVAAEPGETYSIPFSYAEAGATLFVRLSWGPESSLTFIDSLSFPAGSDDTTLDFTLDAIPPLGATNEISMNITYGEGGRIIRRDIALTLFLSEPDSYEGGELEVESPAGPKSVKLPAGSGFAYHCHALHRVTPVTSGARFAAVVWLQSLIPDDEIRQMLFNLTAASSGLEEREGKTDELLLINKVHQNLTRRFARP